MSNFYPVLPSMEEQGMAKACPLIPDVGTCPASLCSGALSSGNPHSSLTFCVGHEPADPSLHHHPGYVMSQIVGKDWYCKEESMV